MHTYEYLILAASLALLAYGVKQLAKTIARNFNIMPLLAVTALMSSVIFVVVGLP